MSAKIFDQALELKCEKCGKNLLEDFEGIFVLLNDPATKKVEDLYVSCKGGCDETLKRLHQKGTNLNDGWYDLKNISNPYGYVKYVMTWLNSFHAGDKISDEAFSKLKNILLNVFPYVCRDFTAEEKEKIDLYKEQGWTEFL